MKFKEYQKTNEAFDKPYKWKISDKKPRYTEYKFTTDKDITYYVAFQQFLGTDPKKTNVTLDTEDEEMGVTGTGDAFRVFATTMEIFKDHKKELQELGLVTFYAREPSRQKLYLRMAKNLKSELGFKKLITNKKPDGLEFIFSN